MEREDVSLNQTRLRIAHCRHSRVRAHTQTHTEPMLRSTVKHLRHTTVTHPHFFEKSSRAAPPRRHSKSRKTACRYPRCLRQRFTDVLEGANKRRVPGRLTIGTGPCISALSSSTWYRCAASLHCLRFQLLGDELFLLGVAPHRKVSSIRLDEEDKPFGMPLRFY